MRFKGLAILISVLLALVISFSVVSGNYLTVHNVTATMNDNLTINLTSQKFSIDSITPWISGDSRINNWSRTQVIYSIPDGVHSPGDEIDCLLRLIARNDPRNLTLVCCLVKTGKNATIVDSNIVYDFGPPSDISTKFTIPEINPASYIVGVIIYDDNGSILLKQVGWVRVGIQELKASLHVVPDHVTNETEVKLIIKNEGRSRIEYGTYYGVEKLVNGSWVPAPTQVIWVDPLYSIRYNDTHKQEVNIKGCDSGAYRIQKKVEAADTTLSEILVANFTVNRPFEPSLYEKPSFGFRYTWGFSSSSMTYPEGPMLHLTNLGARRLFFVNGYTVKKLEEGLTTKTYEYTFNETTLVKWGETFDLKVGEPNLPKGTYVFSIEFEIEDTLYREKISNRFSRH